MRMESVQRQLDETPRYGGPLSPGSWPAVREASVSGGGVATATAEWPVGPAVSAGMTRSVPTQESYRQLREWYDDAVRRREAAEDALAGLLDGQLATDARANATLRWLVTPAHVAEKVGGKPSGRRVCVLAILALVWGAGMAWFIARCEVFATCIPRRNSNSWSRSLWSGSCPSIHWHRASGGFGWANVLRDGPLQPANLRLAHLSWFLSSPPSITGQRWRSWCATRLGR